MVQTLISFPQWDGISKNRVSYQYEELGEVCGSTVVLHPVGMGMQLHREIWGLVERYFLRSTKYNQVGTAVICVEIAWDHVFNRTRFGGPAGSNIGSQ